MSTPSNADPSKGIPNIVTQHETIILTKERECTCGRTKEKIHCPSCGKVRTYGFSDTEPVRLPNGDVLKDCRFYRCQACGLKFSDVDWYFNCTAPIRIDWAATKARIEADTKKAAQEKWMLRIEIGEKFDHNDRVKCKAEAGFDPEEMRFLINRTKQYKKPENKEPPNSK